MPVTKNMEQEDASRPKRWNMDGTILVLLIIAVYFALQLFILPKLGVPT